MHDSPSRSLALRLAAFLIVGPWLCLAVKAPALYWTEQPLPFARIRETAWRIGLVSDTMLLLGLLLVGYVLLAWLVESRGEDLPLATVITVSVLAGLAAFFTYAMFAEDVNFLLGNLWTFSVAGENPYEMSIAEVPNHPFRAFTTWTALEFLYGPVALLPGSLLVRLTGLSVLSGVLAMKATMLLVFWLSGAAIYGIGRGVGARKPVGLAALLLWNPLILAESVMTPHLDLAMAALVLLGTLAWMHRREAAAILLLALSVGVKLVTALFIPLALLGVAISLRERSWQGARSTALVLVILSAVTGALWPGVWEPLLENGVRKELDFDSIGALLPPMVAAIQRLGTGWIRPEEDPWDVAQVWRWMLFVPFWIIAIAGSGRIAWRMRARLPAALLLPLAMVMLGYHVLFTMVVMPWHFITAICLSLASGSRAGRLSAILVTASGLLYHLNDRWVWSVLDGHHTAMTLVMMTSLLSGPALALGLMVVHTWSQGRSAGTAVGVAGSHSLNAERVRRPGHLEAPALSVAASVAIDGDIPALAGAVARRYT